MNPCLPHRWIQVPRRATRLALPRQFQLMRSGRSRSAVCADKFSKVLFCSKGECDAGSRGDAWTRLFPPTPCRGSGPRRARRPMLDQLGEVVGDRVMDLDDPDSGVRPFVNSVTSNRDLTVRLRVVGDVHHIPAPFRRQELHPEHRVDVVVGEAGSAERPVYARKRIKSAGARAACGRTLDRAAAPPRSCWCQAEAPDVARTRRDSAPSGYRCSIRAY